VSSLYPGPLSPTLQTDLPVLDCGDSLMDLNLSSYDLIVNADTDQLSLEIEKERYVISVILYIFIVQNIFHQF